MIPSILELSIFFSMSHDFVMICDLCDYICDVISYFFVQYPRKEKETQNKIKGKWEKENKEKGK